MAPTALAPGTRFSPVSLGRPLKSIEAGDFILTEAAYLPGSTLPRHAHELPSLTFVLSGHCTETIGRNRQECKSHALIIKPGGEVHSNNYGPAGLRCLVIEVKKQRLEPSDPATQVLRRVAFVENGVLPALAMRVYKEFRIEDDVSRLAIEGLILEMLANAARRTMAKQLARAPRWLAEAREFCHEHFAEHISLVDLAQSVGIHPAHLARVFRKQYHSSVGEYVRRLRLDYAARELVSSNKPLAMIAAEAGFYDQSHLTNTFRFQIGMTPSEFRSVLGKDSHLSSTKQNEASVSD